MIAFCDTDIYFVHESQPAGLDSRVPANSDERHERVAVGTVFCITLLLCAGAIVRWLS